MSLAMAFTMMPIMGAQVYADTGFATVSGIKYRYDTSAETAMVADQEAAVSGDIVITSNFTVFGVDCVVTSIGNRAFYDCGSLTNITIPDSVTDIGEMAFFRCG